MNVISEEYRPILHIELLTYGYFKCSKLGDFSCFPFDKTFLKEIAQN